MDLSAPFSEQKRLLRNFRITTTNINVNLHLQHVCFDIGDTQFMIWGGCGGRAMAIHQGELTLTRLTN